MELLTSKEIKKIMLGVCLSDGHVSPGQTRFELYSKHEEYIVYIQNVLDQITGMHTKFYVKHDKRGYTGYRVTTRIHPYWKKMRKYLYNGRKCLTEYSVSRIDEQTLAHIWMCDGYLEHAKNRKKNTVQNIGWFCLEAFPKEELEILQAKLLQMGIGSSLVKKPWGFGYRIRVGGKNLQNLISLVYPYILDCFKYKTLLFYKSKESADMSLSSAEQYIMEYNDVEDIVRHSK